MKKIVLIAICVSTFSNIFCQQTTKDSLYKEIKELATVKGRSKTLKERNEFKRNGQSTEILSQEELNRNNPMFIEQSLNTMAGVQVDKRTQLGGQRIVIRGYGNDQKFNNWGIKSYYNGVPITTADGVTVLDDIDFGIVNNIEVIKGPAATMYGGGVGGVAKFYLKNEENKGVTLQQNLLAGSFGLVQSNSRIDLVNNNSSTSFSYGYLKSDGYRPNGNSDKNYFTIFSDIRISDKQKINIYASHNHSLERVTGQISYADYYAGIDKGNAAYIKKDSRNDFTSTRFSIANTYQFFSNLTNTTSFFYSNGDYLRVAAGALENNLTPNYGVRSVFNLKNNFSKKITSELTFGMELQQSKSLISNFRFTGTNDSFPLQLQDISKGSYFKISNNQSSFFFLERINFNPINLSIIAGLSSNAIKFKRTDLLANPGLIPTYNKNLSFKKSFKATINPHIAIQKTYKNQIFNISYSEGYNAPTSGISFINAINKTNDSLLPERAKMLDISIQGLLLDTKLDYQISWFSMNIKNKLTQLNGIDPVTGTAFSYWSNTGLQHHQGLEASFGYVFTPINNSFFSKLEPFVSYTNYQFKYKKFSTKTGANVVDYSGKKVVGVPKTKYTLGLDIKTSIGLYMNNTLSNINSVYTDFANTNKVKGFNLLNTKIGYKKTFLNKKLDVDIYFAGNNLTNSINYTFLFLGNNANDTDPGSGFPPGVPTDVNPGYNKAYYFGGVSLKYLISK